MDIHAAQYLPGLRPEIRMHGDQDSAEKLLAVTTLRAVSGPWPSRCPQGHENKEGRFEHDLRKSDALKLRPGQTIRYGDSMWSRKCDHNWYEGKVLFVTSQGGIRVQTTFGEQWVP